MKAAVINTMIATQEHCEYRKVRFYRASASACIAYACRAPCFYDKAVRPSIRLSHAGSVSKRMHILSNFPPSGRTFNAGLRCLGALG